MTCGRQVGLWLDEQQLVVASCWQPTGHLWECHDRLRDLRWTPGAGTDSTGRRYLIDLADVADLQPATQTGPGVDCPRS